MRPAFLVPPGCILHSAVCVTHLGRWSLLLLLLLLLAPAPQHALLQGAKALGDVAQRALHLQHKLLAVQGASVCTVLTFWAVSVM